MVGRVNLDLADNQGNLVIAVWQVLLRARALVVFQAIVAYQVIVGHQALVVILDNLVLVALAFQDTQVTVAMLQLRLQVFQAIVVTLEGQALVVFLALAVLPGTVVILVNQVLVEKALAGIAALAAIVVLAVGPGYQAFQAIPVNLALAVYLALVAILVSLALVVLLVSQVIQVYQATAALAVLAVLQVIQEE